MNSDENLGAYTVEYERVSKVIYFDGGYQGNCIKETFKKDGVIHRDFDLPAITYKTADEDGKVISPEDGGRIIQSEFFHEGQRHRIGDKPAVTFDGGDNGEGVKIEHYLKDGLPHREGGKPAFTHTFEDGSIFIEQYFENGKGHRLYSLPADIVRDPGTNVLLFETYAENGKCHRRDGPAYIERCEETGIAYLSTYFRDGQYYREGGKPVEVIRDVPSGNIIEEYSAQELRAQELNETKSSPSPEPI